MSSQHYRDCDRCGERYVGQGAIDSYLRGRENGDEICVRCLNHEEPRRTAAFTDAPDAYDGFGTSRIAVVARNKKGNDIWKVSVVDQHREWQLGRYMSGLHLAVDAAEFGKLLDYKLIDPVDQKGDDDDDR